MKVLVVIFLLSSIVAVTAKSFDFQKRLQNLLKLELEAEKKENPPRCPPEYDVDNPTPGCNPPPNKERRQEKDKPQGERPSPPPGERPSPPPGFPPPQGEGYQPDKDRRQEKDKPQGEKPSPPPGDRPSSPPGERPSPPLGERPSPPPGSPPPPPQGEGYPPPKNALDQERELKIDNFLRSLGNILLEEE
uniref:Proline-rich protein 2-like n=1 Tax=Crassostrea virginica TaxID=6565 RepID=A0A8B8B4Z0_CRAVI|nr:proline-rich protein 2-like [Crassostrea virginica]